MSRVGGGEVVRELVEGLPARRLGEPAPGVERGQRLAPGSGTSESAAAPPRSAASRSATEGPRGVGGGPAAAVSERFFRGFAASMSSMAAWNAAPGTGGRRRGGAPRPRA
ncbi:MAG: hypothetical protein H6745_20545 [Deltaproteobacteria bacterium]|nr:hypothetical protein [Deltaproteobacteria bacterium]